MLLEDANSRKSLTELLSPELFKLPKQFLGSLSVLRHVAASVTGAKCLKLLSERTPSGCDEKE